MKKQNAMKKFLLFALSLCFAFTMQAEDLPAFPGAEGYARYITGGRGGEVYYVTSLEDDNSEGTLRWAINKSGARTIVFAVSGTIYLNSSLTIRNGNLTIAGQTAPGDGICVAGYPVGIRASNVIIRYMRFRLGNENVAKEEAANGANSVDGFDGLNAMDTENIMIDHCSVSWSVDECCSVLGNKNTTLQWCIVSQSMYNSGHSKGNHGYGGNWGGSGASFHHNLVAHHSSRTPRLGPRPTTQLDERMDMRNNVIYNWCGNGCYGGEGQSVNIVNNYYKPGPGTNKSSSSVRYRIAGIGIRTNSYVKTYPDYAPALHLWGKYFVDGNTVVGYADVTADNWTKGIYAQINSSDCDGTYTSVTKDTIKLYEPIDFYATTTHTAAVAYEKVLKYAGASLSRDRLDSTMVNDTRDGVATFTGSTAGKPGIIDSQEDCIPEGYDIAWPELKSRRAPVDNDGDGIDDNWEEIYGLDFTDPSDRNKIAPSGYTYLESYINSLCASITAGCTSDGELLGLIKDSSIVPDEPVDETATLSASTYTATESGAWVYSNGYSITTSKGYATGNNNAFKMSRNTDFVINIPEGVQVTAVTVNAYSNVDDGTAYLSKLNDVSYTSSEYSFPSRSTSTTATHTITFDAPLTGSFNIRFGDNQVGAIITLHQERASTSDVIEVVSHDKDLNRLVDVYNMMGRCVKMQIPYKDIFTTLPRGFYVVEGEKLIVR
ncbi:MAG: pectate lyase [Coprobacter sp.]|nr:pectate lyase [Coprobacter sp.]